MAYKVGDKKGEQEEGKKRSRRRNVPKDESKGSQEGEKVSMEPEFKEMELELLQRGGAE